MTNGLTTEGLWKATTNEAYSALVDYCSDVLRSDFVVSSLIPRIVSPLRDRLSFGGVGHMLDSPPQKKGNIQPELLVCGAGLWCLQSDF